MSDSPGPGGDAENLFDPKSSRLRPAEVDDGIDAVPAKFLKVDDVAELEEDDDDDDAAALEDEGNEDFEDEEDDEPDEDIDFGDEEEGTAEYEPATEENLIDETGESSDLDDFIQANLADIDDCQSDIEVLNKKANDEILKVEQKYNKLRQPVFTRRNKCIDKIPNFWATVFSRHPQLKRVLTKEDIKCLKFMTSLQIDDFDDSRSGYRLKFTFAKNVWFSNSSITKEYHLPWHDSPSCECTRIDWYPGMNLTKKPSSFFSWFCSQEDASTDDIAEIIKEELWPNPLQSYLMKENGEVASSEESDEEDGPVYVDEDDDVEYVSSEGEDWKEYRRPPALGKEAPSTSKHEQYDDDEENEDGIEYEEDLEDDDDADIQSRGNYGFDEMDEIPPLEDDEVPNVVQKKPRLVEEENFDEEDLADISSRGEYGFSDETATPQRDDVATDDVTNGAKTNNLSTGDEAQPASSNDASDLPTKSTTSDVAEDPSATVSTSET